VLISPAVRNVLLAAAREARVPYQFEVMPHTSTDASAMQIVRGGTYAGGLAIPLRYLHTPSEMVDFDDVQNAIKLLLALLSKPFSMQNA
jgi:tetrahedral aminopeptidase